MLAHLYVHNVLSCSNTTVTVYISLLQYSIIPCSQNECKFNACLFYYSIVLNWLHGWPGVGWVWGIIRKFIWKSHAMKSYMTSVWEWGGVSLIYHNRGYRFRVTSNPTLPFSFLIYSIHNKKQSCGKLYLFETLSYKFWYLYFMCWCLKLIS